MPERNFDALDGDRRKKAIEYVPGYDWIPGKFGPPPGIPKDIKERFDRMSDKEYLYAFLKLSQEEKESLMVSEAERRRTFAAHWPIETIVKANDCAKEGFYYTGVADRVQCAFCGGIVRNWERGDVPKFQHKNYFNYCKMVQNKPCQNIPISDFGLPRDLMTSQLGSTVSSYCKPIALSDLGINTVRAVDPALSVFSRRKESYIGYLESNYELPKDLMVNHLSSSMRNYYRRMLRELRAELERQLAGLKSKKRQWRESEAGGPPRSSFVPDHLEWIFNPSLHGISSAFPPPPSYLTEVWCYPAGYHGAAVPDQLSVALQQELAGLHGHLQTTYLVPDNLNWIFNPSLYGISSAVPPPPSYLTDVLCYVVGYHDNATAVPDQLSVALQQELAVMSPQQYRAAVRNDLSPIQLYWLMSIEMQRRRTFLDDWPHSGNLSGEQMAQSGLYHSGGYDSVRCYFCGVVLEKWEVGDDPMTEHKRWSTGCMFMASWDCTIMGQQPSEDALPQQETAR